MNGSSAVLSGSLQPATQVGSVVVHTQAGVCREVRELCLFGSLKDTFCPFETWLFPPK